MSSDFAREKAKRETKERMERTREELRAWRDANLAVLPLLAVVDINHIVTELGIVIEHLQAPTALLDRGTIE